MYHIFGFEDDINNFIFDTFNLNTNTVSTPIPLSTVYGEIWPTNFGDGIRGLEYVGSDQFLATTFRGFMLKITTAGVVSVLANYDVIVRAGYAMPAGKLNGKYHRVSL